MSGYGTLPSLSASALRELIQDLLDVDEVGLCGSCNIQLDYFRDGTDDNGCRCHNCYWSDQGQDEKLITPDYREEGVQKNVLFEDPIVQKNVLFEDPIVQKNEINLIHQKSILLYITK